MSTVRIQVQNYCVFCKSTYREAVCPQCNDKREISVTVKRVDSLAVTPPSPKTSKRK